MRVSKHGCDILDSGTFKNYFVKTIEHFFFVYIAIMLILRGVGEFLKVMQMRDVVKGLHNCLDFSQPSSCLDEAM